MAGEVHQAVAVDAQLVQTRFPAQIRQVDDERGIFHFTAQAADQFVVASMVPPVASRSSTTSTLSPAVMASVWISSLSVPYSSS